MNCMLDKLEQCLDSNGFAKEVFDFLEKFYDNCRSMYKCEVYKKLWTLMKEITKTSGLKIYTIRIF